MTAAPAQPLIDGRYRVVGLLGEGTSSRTLECEEVDGGRRVAIKELRVELVDRWKYLELFEREARVLASLRHAGVPEVYRTFEARENGGRPTLYLVQELIDGPSLLTRIGQGPALGEVEIIDIALGVLDILAYLHSRVPPVFHRDIKPSNVLLRSSGAPVLVDFGGVCHGWRPSGKGSTVVGTFGYMPPEQLLGQVGPTSDLYALGATLLHAITGTAPTDFNFDSGRLSLPPEVTIRPSLHRLVDTLLSPAPRDRPQSARAAREKLLEGPAEGAPSRPAGAPPPSRALVPTTPRALAPASRGAPATIRGRGHPSPVDAGPPPRDTKGALADVYLNLIEPLDDTDRIDSRALRGLITVGWWLLGLSTGGILPLIYYTHVAGRRRRYKDLFKFGEVTTGVLASTYGREPHNLFATFAYDYQAADGVSYRGYFDASVRLTRYWAVGDPVTVLYDRGDPAHSCIVYRWK